MPDLFTHTLLASPIAVGTRRYLPTFWVLFGATFPDIASRSIMVLLPNSYEMFWFASALHTPIAVALLAYGFSLLFAKGERTKIFWGIIVGSILHFILDLMQRHYLGGYHLLFPFSYDSVEFPLFWPEAPVDLIRNLF